MSEEFWGMSSSDYVAAGTTPTSTQLKLLKDLIIKELVARGFRRDIAEERAHDEVHAMLQTLMKDVLNNITVSVAQNKIAGTVEATLTTTPRRRTHTLLIT